MNITFPNFGPAAMVLPKVLSSIGISCTIPHPNNEEALELGKAVSPEEICIPFKYMAGNLIKGYRNGADTVLMAATCGPCRLGEYCELLRVCMKNNNYDFRWIVINTPGSVNNKLGITAMVRRMKNAGVNPVSAILALARGLKLVFALDGLRRYVNRFAAGLQEPGKALGIVKDVEAEIYSLTGFKESFRVVKEGKKKLRSLNKNPEANPIKVLLVGEIYTSMESEANCHIEEALIGMGCSIDRHMDMSWWIGHTLWGLITFEKRKTSSRGSKMCDIGGYCKATVEKVAGCRKTDGIIKIMPSGCMPEIVSKACCEALQEKRGYRILHLVFDEMTGSAGYVTRLEAFVDMLERRRDVLAGNRHRIHKHRFCNNR